MSYKNYNFEYIASDYNSPFFRNYIWTTGFTKYPELLDLPQLMVGIFSNHNAIDYVVDISTWIKCHEKLKERALADYRYVENLIDQTLDLGKNLNSWTEKEIFNKNLEKLENQKLFELYREFIDKQSVLYAYGVALPILDFQDFSFVEGNLEKFLKSKVSESEYQEYYSVFTYPVKNSFAQDQEEDLLRLMREFYSEQWAKNVETKDLSELKALYPEFYKKLQEHTKKYCWVYYVYTGPAYEEENFLDAIKDYLRKGIKPSEKLKQLADREKKLKRLKQEYIEKLKPDKFNSAILNLAGKVMWAKPNRKDLQSKSYYHLENLHREIGRRLHLSLDQVRSAPMDILQKALQTSKIDVDVINQIAKFHICLPNDDKTISILHGEKARDFYENEVKKEDLEQETGKINKLRGTCACAGKAKGMVKIINQPPEMGKMRYGDILVAAATTPAIVPAMKKAGAIVTDEGGLTCHVSIVSRELGIPCVIGAKIATKVFKDGDKVEVDADKGIVRRA